MCLKKFMSIHTVCICADISKYGPVQDVEPRSIVAHPELLEKAIDQLLHRKRTRYLGQAGYPRRSDVLMDEAEEKEPPKSAQRDVWRLWDVFKQFVRLCHRTQHVASCVPRSRWGPNGSHRGVHGGYLD